jgi:hypothetical protein
MPVFGVEGHQMLQVVWVSFAACIGISVLFSLVIVGSARAGEARRAGHAVAAVPWFVLAVICFALFAGGVALGVHAMVQR